MRTQHNVTYQIASGFIVEHKEGVYTVIDPYMTKKRRLLGVCQLISGQFEDGITDRPYDWVSLHDNQIIPGLVDYNMLRNSTSNVHVISDQAVFELVRARVSREVFRMPDGSYLVCRNKPPGSTSCGVLKMIKVGFGQTTAKNFRKRFLISGLPSPLASQGAYAGTPQPGAAARRIAGRDNSHIARNTNLSLELHLDTQSQRATYDSIVGEAPAYASVLSKCLEKMRTFRVRNRYKVPEVATYWGTSEPILKVYKHTTLLSYARLSARFVYLLDHWESLGLESPGFEIPPEISPNSGASTTARSAALHTLARQILDDHGNLQKQTFFQHVLNLALFHPADPTHLLSNYNMQQMCQAVRTLLLSSLYYSNDEAQTTADFQSFLVDKDHVSEAFLLIKSVWVAAQKDKTEQRRIQVQFDESTKVATILGAGTFSPAFLRQMYTGAYESYMHNLEVLATAFTESYITPDQLWLLLVNRISTNDKYNFMDSFTGSNLGVDLPTVSTRNSAFLLAYNQCMASMATFLWVASGCKLRAPETIMLGYQGEYRNLLWDVQRKTLYIRIQYSQNRSNTTRILYLDRKCSKLLTHYIFVVKSLALDYIGPSTVSYAAMTENLNDEGQDDDADEDDDDEDVEDVDDDLDHIGALDDEVFQTGGTPSSASDLVRKLLFVRVDQTPRPQTFKAKFLSADTFRRQLMVAYNSSRDGQVPPYMSMRYMRQGAVCVSRNILVEAWERRRAGLSLTESAFGNGMTSGYFVYGGMSERGVNDAKVTLPNSMMLQQAWENLVGILSWAGVWDFAPEPAKVRTPDAVYLSPKKERMCRCVDLAAVSLNGIAELRPEQRDLLCEIAVCQSDPFHVIQAPTGWGKSVVFLWGLRMISRKFHQGLPINVVVVPGIALKEDMIRRFAEYGVDAREIDSIHRDLLSNDFPELYLAVVDSFVQNSTRLALRAAGLRHLLGGLILDDCHTILTDASYRPAMTKLSLANYDSFEFVWAFSATISDRDALDLSRRLGISTRCCNYHNWVKCLPGRDRVYCDCENYPANRSLDRLRDLLQNWHAHYPSNKAIVFFYSIAELESVKASMPQSSRLVSIHEVPKAQRQSPEYDMLEERQNLQEKIRSFVSSENSRGEVAFATSMLLNGIDLGSINFIVFYNYTPQTSQLIQGVGRCRGKGVVLMLGPRPTFCYTDLLAKFYKLPRTPPHQNCCSFYDPELESTVENILGFKAPEPSTSPTRSPSPVPPPPEPDAHIPLWLPTSSRRFADLTFPPSPLQKWRRVVTAAEFGLHMDGDTCHCFRHEWCQPVPPTAVCPHSIRLMDLLSLLQSHQVFTPVDLYAVKDDTSMVRLCDRIAATPLPPLTMFKPIIPASYTSQKIDLDLPDYASRITSITAANILSLFGPVAVSPDNDLPLVEYGPVELADIVSAEAMKLDTTHYYTSSRFIHAVAALPYFKRDIAYSLEEQCNNCDGWHTHLDCPFSEQGVNFKSLRAVKSLLFAFGCISGVCSCAPVPRSTNSAVRATIDLVSYRLHCIASTYKVDDRLISMYDSMCDESMNAMAQQPFTQSKRPRRTVETI